MRDEGSMTPEAPEMRPGRGRREPQEKSWIGRSEMVGLGGGGTETGRFGASKFAEVNEMIVSGNDEHGVALTAAELVQAKNRRGRLADDAEAVGAFQGVETAIVQALKGSTWETFDDRLSELADKLEAKAGRFTGYRERDMGGLVAAAVQGVELLAEWGGKSKMTPEQRQRFGVTPGELQFLKDRIGREVFWKPREGETLDQLAARLAGWVDWQPQPPTGDADKLEKLFRRGGRFEDFANRAWGWSFGSTAWIDTPPDWYDKLTEQQKSQMRFYEGMANAAAVKRRFGATDLKSTQENQAMVEGLSMLDVKDFYESAGGRECLERLVQHFFVLDESTGVALLRFRGNAGSEERKTVIQEWARAEKFDSTRKGIVAELAREPEVVAEAREYGVAPGDLMKAKLGVASALLSVANVAESADVDREMPPGSPNYSEQVRAEFHPLAKLMAKIKLGREASEVEGTLEGWGGSIGDWMAEHAIRAGLGDDIADGRMRPFPETMFVSMLELVEDAGGVSIAERLVKGVGVVWERNGEVMKVQNWWGDYADKWSAVTAAYEYAVGKKPVGKDWPEWKAWGGDLANAWAKLKGTQVARFCQNEEALLWTAVNSLGVDTKKPSLKIQGYPYLYKVIEMMISDRLCYIVDERTGEQKHDKGVVGRIKGRLGAGMLKSLISSQIK